MARKQYGHARLKSALVLRDALMADLGLPLTSLMAHLSRVEHNLGAATALEEGRYLEAAESLCKQDKSVLAQLDATVRMACAKVKLMPRYAQYLALILFTRWLELQQTDGAALLARLNDWLADHPPKNETLPPFDESDLQYAAFWMATASGKTHVLHACLALLTEKDVWAWDRIFLIPPGDALTRQHVHKLRELQKWRVFAYPMDGDYLALRRLPDDAVIVLDINKLAEKKTDEGIRVPTSAFKAGRNLVFVDEGHKGQKSEKSLWKKLQDDLAGIGAPTSSQRGMLIEFSATFGQVAEAEHAFDRYAKSIILDYAYDQFHTDLYGKDFWHSHIGSSAHSEAAVQEKTLAAALLAFWNQLIHHKTAKTQNLLTEKGLDVPRPLWMLLGLSVIGGTNKSDQEQTSDVIEVLTFLFRILSRRKALEELVRDLPEAASTDIDMLPRSVRNAMTGQSNKDIATRVLSDVFAWQPGDKPVLRLLKSAEGEMGLGLMRGDQVHYYGVVNVGDAGGLKKALQTSGLAVDDDAICESLFADLGRDHSSVNILIGSRRFAEGWDNYRASSLTLLRLGVGEGSLIIQMFGRVVRFAGVHGNGKRLENPDPPLRPLQTAYIYGLRSGYLKSFLDSLYANGVPKKTEINCPFHVYLPHDIDLQSVRTIMPGPDAFHLAAFGDRWLNGVNKITFSLAATVLTARLSRDKVLTEKGAVGTDITSRFKQILPFLDLDDIYREMISLKSRMGWWNFSFDRAAIVCALNSDRYQIEGLPSALSIGNESDLIRLNRIAAALVRRLFEGAYRKAESRKSRYALVKAERSGIPKTYRKGWTDA